MVCAGALLKPVRAWHGAAARSHRAPCLNLAGPLDRDQGQSDGLEPP